MKKLKAGIVGLGQVGLLFDREKSRDGIWTHFSAYEFLSDYYELVAVADPVEERRNIALLRNNSLIATENIEIMLESVKLDVISLCTPPSNHLSGLIKASGNVKGVFCEKPLCGVDQISDVSKVLQLCEQNKTYVAVNYYKRKEPRFKDAYAYIQGEKIGKVTQANAFYSGPMEAVGSHAIDFLIYLFGEPDVLSTTKRDFGDEDPGYDVLLKFENDVVGYMICTGKRHNLIFEVDIIGEKGRIRVSDNGARMEYYTFKNDKRYEGYKSLAEETVPSMGSNDRFVDYLIELWNMINGTGSNLTCSIYSAYKTQKALYEICTNRTEIQ